MSPYEIGDIKASTPKFNNGTFVDLEDYRRLELSTAQSKRASKRAKLASADAKEEYRRRRLHAVVNADDGGQLEPGQLSRVARDDHVSIMSILENHKMTLERHSASLKNKIDASIVVQNKALPLRFLFTVEGGAEYCRARLKAAFKLWIHGFECAQKTVALSVWKIRIDEQIKIEKHAEYRAQAGRAKLKVIIMEVRK